MSTNYMAAHSGMHVDGHGLLHAGAEAEFPTHAVGGPNIGSLVGNIPNFYTKIDFRSISVSLRPPKPGGSWYNKKIYRTAGLFVLYLAPTPIQWGQIVASYIVRAFQEPVNLIAPGFVADLYRANNFVILFHEVGGAHPSGNPSNMEIQVTGQLR